MHDPHAVHRFVDLGTADAVTGHVRWDPVRSLWNGGAMAVTLIGGPLTMTLGAVALFVGLTGAGLLLGHSVGFHRRLIHESFACPLWLERVLAWFGTAVGMGGPLWMMRAHDLRDWAQRLPACHPYLAHGRAPLGDAWWQLHCRLVLDHPPRFDQGRVGRDPFYRFLEATWAWQQLPIAALCWWAGGWGFVVWGVAARIFASAHGHWLIGWLAHNRGPQKWLVEGSGVQAHDVPWAGLMTMGEAWHNNHHAWPASAKLGVYAGQSDGGFAFIRVLERVGLAWDVRTPDNLPARTALRPVESDTYVAGRALAKAGAQS